MIVSQERRRERSPAAVQAGFTLIEVLIALAILAFMMAIAWGTLSQTANTKLQVEEIQERSHEIRVALERMVRDIEAAYLSSNEDRNLSDHRTYLVGKNKGDLHELRFSSLAHQTMWADANESEQTAIAYYSDSDRKDRRKTNLVRRESRRLENKRWEQIPGEVDILVRNVEKVQFEYFDWKTRDWKDTWDTTSATANGGGQPWLPGRVRITIQVKSKRGDSIKYTTQARIGLQELLDTTSGT
jgi:general secretion pathway protein J